MLLWKRRMLGNHSKNTFTTAAVAEAHHLSSVTLFSVFALLPSTRQAKPWTMKEGNDHKSSIEGNTERVTVCYLR